MLLRMKMGQPQKKITKLMMLRVLLVGERPVSVELRRQAYLLIYIKIHSQWLQAQYKKTYLLKLVYSFRLPTKGRLSAMQ